MSSGIIRDGSEDVVAVRAVKRKGENKLSKRLLIRTLFLLAVCGVAAFIVLAARLYDLQIVNNSYYVARTLSGQLRETSIEASRGSIYDTDGNLLAMSGPVENVFISPLEIIECEQDARLIAEGLSYILGVDFNYIIDRTTRSSSQYQVIKAKVESEEAERVREFIRDHNLKGIYFEPATMRYYPNNHLASHVLGFVGTDNYGLDGVERTYNSHLEGIDGRNIRITNATGGDLRLAGFGDYYAARHGDNLWLTINTSVQYYVDKHLQQAIIDYDIKNGAMCIAMNPRTGEILAIANYPTYDPNDFLKINDSEMDKLSLIEDEDEFKQAYIAAQHRQWRNRILADSYEPGSVFKIITLAMALEENKANPNTVFECEGSIDVRLYDGVSQRNCWNTWGHGSQTLSSAIHNSCNVACVRMGLSVGARTFYKYIDAFGLFDKTGLDNSAEARSLWWSENVFFDRGNETQLASASFGQTFKITPIQMITAAAATVNGGYMMQPYLVKQITDADGNITTVNEPTVLRQVLSGETSAELRFILEDVVNVGTGRNASVSGYRIGGKTGTSENIEQLARRDEDDTSNKDYIASFLGFAPADDPQIMILLLLDTPSHDTGIYISGGNMAAPVVGKMFADILPMSLGIMPSYSDIGEMNVHIPRVTGRRTKDAIDALESNGFVYDIIGEGDTVIGQLPVPNANVSSGTVVLLYTDEEVPRHNVTVPYLYGMNYWEAKEVLASCGLFIRTTGAPKTDDKVRVTVQSIVAGREVQYGAIVEVTLIDQDASERRTN